MSVLNIVSGYIILIKIIEYIVPDKNTIYRQRRKLSRMIKNKIDSCEIETVKNCFCHI